MPQRDSTWALGVKFGLHFGSPAPRVTRGPLHLPCSIQQLHERVTQLCAEYRALYEQLNLPELGPRLDWARILDQKMVTAPGAG